jgi:hypothetical protein
MSDFFDAIGNIFGDSGGSTSDYVSLAKPLVEVGLGAYTQNERNKERQKLVDYFKQKEQQQFLDNQNDQAAYQEFLAQGGGGDGGAGRAAAARQSEQNRIKALKNAINVYKQYQNQANKLYSPYIQASKKIIPAQTKTYLGGLNYLDNMSSYYNDPKRAGYSDPRNVQSLFNMNVPLPSYLGT